VTKVLVVSMSKGRVTRKQEKYKVRKLMKSLAMRLVPVHKTNTTVGLVYGTRFSEDGVT
jgi:hypothetical protein